MSNVRMNLVTAIVGGRGVGKTTYLLKLVNDLIESKNQKVLILDTIDHPSYRMVAKIEADMLSGWVKPAVYRLVTSDPDDIIRRVQLHVKNTLVVFEDASKWINKSMQKDVRKMIFDSKQRNNDIIFMFHGFMATPPELFRYVDAVTLFKTGDQPASRKRDMINYVEIEKAWKKVIASKNRYENVTIQIY